MGNNAFSDIPRADQTAILKQIGSPERTACKRLEEIDCDTNLLLFDLWCATNPGLLDGKKSFKAQHEQHRSELVRFKKLIRDIEDLRSRLAQAAKYWRTPPNGMATLD